MNPEQLARQTNDRLLSQAGWQVSDVATANIQAYRGLVLREFPLPGQGFADYLLYVDGKAAGVIEAKKAGTTLMGVEIRSEKYTQGLPPELPAHQRPLPFSYQSSGGETRFTNGQDPQPRARPGFAFHQPEHLAELLESAATGATKNPVGAAPSPRLAAVAEASASYGSTGNFLARLRQMPPLIEEGLWSAQIKAISNLEKSLRENRPRALIQMATGSGKAAPAHPCARGIRTSMPKTFTVISFIYRLIKFGGARRVLFLVDCGNLGDQTRKDKSVGLPIWSRVTRPEGGGARMHRRQFQQYVSPYNNFKLSEGERRPFVQWTNAALRTRCQEGKAGARERHLRCARDGVAGLQALRATPSTPRRGSASAPSSACTPC